MHVKMGRTKFNTDLIVKREEVWRGLGDQAERNGTRVHFADGSSVLVSEAFDTHIDTVLGADYNDTFEEA